jgi:uncharacterized protein YceK
MRDYHINYLSQGPLLVTSGCSTVVEHLTTYPEIRGSNPTTTRHREETADKKYSSEPIQLLSSLASNQTQLLHRFNGLLKPYSQNSILLSYDWAQ